jgi:exonuclease-1
LRAENLEKATTLESQGRWREAREFYTKCVDITPEMAFQLIKVG